MVAENKSLDPTGAIPPTSPNAKQGVPATIKSTVPTARNTEPQNADAIDRETQLETIALLPSDLDSNVPTGSAQITPTLPSTTAIASMPPTLVPANLAASTTSSGGVNDDKLSGAKLMGDDGGNSTTNDNNLPSGGGSVRVGNESEPVMDTSDDVSSGSNTTLTISDDILPLSGWLKDAATYFRTILTKKAWLDLVSKWLIFEQACQTEGVSGIQVRYMKSKLTIATIETANKI
jgi:hypothetical protein